MMQPHSQPGLAARTMELLHFTFEGPCPRDLQPLGSVHEELWVVKGPAIPGPTPPVEKPTSLRTAVQIALRSWRASLGLRFFSRQPYLFIHVFILMDDHQQNNQSVPFPPPQKKKFIGF
jgi:hypothetical protein